MALHAVLSTLMIFTIVAPLQGARIFLHTLFEPTPGLPGYTTWTLRAESSHLMQGFDFAGDGSNDPATGKGFFGPMNQVNPAGIPTIYSDNNVLFAPLGLVPKQDSQFLVRAADVVVPAGFAEEGPNILQGIWAHATPVATMNSAQIVVPNNGSIIHSRGIISTREGTAIVENQVTRSLSFLPEPVNAMLAGIAAVGCLLLRWRN